MELHFPLILDGATGTQLQSRGYTGGECMETWVLEHPEAILDIQRGYVAAGSQILYAPTFGANRVKLSGNGVTGGVAEYNQKLVALTKQAADGKAWVGGDIAPTGLFLAPVGQTHFEELVDIYTEQAAALEAAGVDIFGVETSMTMPEVRAAVLAIKSVSRKPVFVSFTCDTNGRTLSGTDVVAALVVMQAMGVDAFGLNCCAGPEQILPVLKRLHDYAYVPLIAKPNAGLPDMRNGRAVYHCPPEIFTAHLNAMAEAGVGIFGGCCGTTEAHIAALREKTASLSIAPAAPRFGESLVCATERDVFVLMPDVQCGTILPCDSTLEDALEEEADAPSPMTAVAIRRAEELSVFEECQYGISKPLCLVCEDAALLESALRLYQGRALYEGHLPEETLAPLAKKYGLIY